MPSRRRHGGAGRSVHSRAGLGVEALLSHALRQKPLPESVVDLVRPVWFRSSLQKEPPAAARPGEVPALRHGRGHAHELHQQFVQLFGTSDPPRPRRRPSPALPKAPAIPSGNESAAVGAEISPLRPRCTLPVQNRRYAFARLCHAPRLLWSLSMSLRCSPLSFNALRLFPFRPSLICLPSLLCLLTHPPTHSVAYARTRLFFRRLATNRRTKRAVITTAPKRKTQGAAGMLFSRGPP
jgi:hypothetical protein